MDGNDRGEKYMTKQDILEATTELRDAMIEFLELSETQDNIKIALQKAQYRLLKAKEFIRQ